jgi:hypothetical protein
MDETRALISASEAASASAASSSQYWKRYNDGAVAQVRILASWFKVKQQNAEARRAFS